MTMRCWKGVGLAVVLTVVPGIRAHAAGGRPSDSVLNAMGLGGLTVISDDDAMSIRGHGYKQSSSVVVFGNSFATIDSPHGTAHSENGYAADGKHFAAGGNHSEAGIVVKTGGGGHGGGNPWGQNGRRWGRGKNGGMNMGGGQNGGSSAGKTIKVFAGGYSFGIAH